MSCILKEEIAHFTTDCNHYHECSYCIFCCSDVKVAGTSRGLFSISLSGRYHRIPVIIMGEKLKKFLHGIWKEYAELLSHSVDSSWDIRSN